MRATNRALGEIFGPNIRFCVPLFQRPYVWDEEPNWVPLWEAIRYVAERRVQGLPPKPYFLGAIVLEQLETNTCEPDARQVIDGQQRLTTLQLVIAAMRDVARDLAQAEYPDAFEQLTLNRFPGKRDTDLVFKVWPTNQDRAAFRKIVPQGADLERASVPGGDANRLLRAYRFFRDRTYEWLGEDGQLSVGGRLGALFTAIQSDLVLVVIDLTEGDDAQVIFETLNALGTPLLPADLVKNFLFHEAEHKGFDLQQLYDTYWTPFERNEEFWRGEIRTGRLKRKAIDVFLQHYLTLKRLADVGSTHLFSAYKEYYRSTQEPSPDNMLREFHDYAAVYRGFSQLPPESAEGRFFERLTVLDTQTVVPLLLEVFFRLGSEDERLAILRDLESYLVRRAICRLTSKNYNRFFLELVQRAAEASFSADAVSAFLLKAEGEATRWPTDAEVAERLSHVPVYGYMPQERVRMVFEAIEAALYDPRSEQVRFLKPLTIEHVLPQKWEACWPLPDDGDEGRKATRERLLHTLGNLTLVTEKLNPELSNAAWPTKRKALGKHAALKLNRLLIERDSWDEAAIMQRSKELAAVCCQVWPRGGV